MSEHVQQLNEATVAALVEVMRRYVTVDGAALWQDVLMENLSSSVTHYWDTVDNLNAVECALAAVIDQAMTDLAGDGLMPGEERVQIVELACYTSGSGNVTWKAFDDAGDLVFYIRQSNKQMFEDAGLLLEATVIGETYDCEMTVIIKPDEGNASFMSPVRVEGEAVLVIPQTVSEPRELGVVMEWRWVDTPSTTFDRILAAAFENGTMTVYGNETVDENSDLVFVPDMVTLKVQHDDEQGENEWETLMDGAQPLENVPCEVALDEIEQAARDRFAKDEARRVKGIPF